MTELEKLKAAGYDLFVRKHMLERELSAVNTALMELDAKVVEATRQAADARPQD